MNLSSLITMATVFLLKGLYFAFVYVCVCLCRKYLHNYLFNHATSFWGEIFPPTQGI